MITQAVRPDALYRENLSLTEGADDNQNPTWHCCQGGDSGQSERQRKSPAPWCKPPHRWPNIPRCVPATTLHLDTNPPFASAPFQPPYLASPTSPSRANRTFVSTSLTASRCRICDLSRSRCRTRFKKRSQT